MLKFFKTTLEVGDRIKLYEVLTDRYTNVLKKGSIRPGYQFSKSGIVALFVLNETGHPETFPFWIDDRVNKSEIKVVCTATIKSLNKPSRNG